MSDSISKINLLEKIREICEINTRKKIWEEIQPEDEFQFIVDLIDEELKWVNIGLNGTNIQHLKI